MTPKMTALRNTALMLGTGLGIGFATNIAFTYLTLMQAVIIFAVLALVGLGKLVYDIELAKAEYKESMKDLKG